MLLEVSLPEKELRLCLCGLTRMSWIARMRCISNEVVFRKEA